MQTTATQAVIDKGFRLADEGRVDPQSYDLVRAYRVRGDHDTYTTTVVGRGNDVRPLSCTCPRFTNGGQLCSHLVAAVRTAVRADNPDPFDRLDQTN